MALIELAEQQRQQQIQEARDRELAEQRRQQQTQQARYNQQQGVQNGNGVYRQPSNIQHFSHFVGPNFIGPYLKGTQTAEQQSF
jgi:hypothetical protein